MITWNSNDTAAGTSAAQPEQFHTDEPESAAVEVSGDEPEHGEVDAALGFPEAQDAAAVSDETQTADEDQAGREESAADPDEIADYDYSTLENSLCRNVAENAASVKEEASGNILLAGTAGFLGIHVLKAFLDSRDSKVYVMVRKGNYASPQRRLMNMLMYYFDNPCDEYFGERIVCIDADAAEENSLEKLKRYAFRTVIHCEADDAQPAGGGFRRDVHLDGTGNLIAFCRETGCRLIEISTVSVAGEGIDDRPGRSRALAENELYIGQQMTDEYIRTKFLAERAVLEAIGSGLDAKIIRVGNVMSRNSDGEFQIHSSASPFLRRLRGYATTGSFPESGMDESVELSPVDSTADAILRLAGTDKRFTVYHACNSHRIRMGNVINAMKNHGFDIRIAEDAGCGQARREYEAAHEDGGPDAAVSAGVSGDESYTVGYENQFTTEVLQSLGYQWPETDRSYLEKAIDALDGLGFFEFD